MTVWGVAQDDVLSAARGGRLFVEWVELMPGVEVMADAARMDGVRVPVTATTAMVVAREWEAELPTPAMLDLRHAAAVKWGLVVQPATQDYRTMQTREAVMAFSRHIDDAGAPTSVYLERRGRPLIVSDVGKAWVETAELRRRKRAGDRGLACNYGFFTSQPRTPRGMTGPKPSVTGQWNVWQEPGYRHNADHWDYSQTLQLIRVRPGCQQPSHDGLTGLPIANLAAEPPIAAAPASSTASDDQGVAVAVVLGAFVAAMLSATLKRIG